MATPLENQSLQNPNPPQKDTGKKRSFLGKLLLSSAFAGLTFIGGQKFINDNPEIFEPAYAKPENLKTQFEINAQDVSAFAKSDTEACLAYAFADYVDPLKEKLQSIIPLMQQIFSQRQEIVFYEIQILLERQKIFDEYTAQGFEVNQESIRSSRIDEYEQIIFEINERLLPLEISRREVVYGTLEQFDNVILYLHEQGLLENLPTDQLISAYDILKLTEVITGSADSDSARAIYLATDLLSAIGQTWFLIESAYLPLLQQDDEIRHSVREWKTPETPEEFLKAQEVLIHLAEKILAIQFGDNLSGLVPATKFQHIDNGKVLGLFEDATNTILFNSNPESILWQDPQLAIESIVHEGAHALLNMYSILHLTHKNNPADYTTTEHNLKSHELVFKSVDTYIPFNENQLTYHSNPHEVLARRAGRMALGVLNADRQVLKDFKEEYEEFYDNGKAHETYQQELAQRGTVLCDNFNLSFTKRSNFITRGFNRYVLNNPHHFIP